MNMPSTIPTLSHCPIPYGVGQWDKPQNGGTARGTRNGEVSLKALAANVLRSVPRGTNGGTSDGTSPKTVGQDASISGGFVPGPKPANSPQLPPVKQTPAARPAVPYDAPPLAALSRFEADPMGVVEWLASQNHGQPAHLVQRWAACVRAEARSRIAAAEVEA